MAVTAGSADAEMSRSGVATNLFDRFFADIVENEICHQGVIPGGHGLVPKVKVHQWAELTSWKAAEETLQALGFNAAADDAWELLGLHKDVVAPSTDDLEKRRRIIQTVLSSQVAHRWSERDIRMGTEFAAAINKGLDICHRELPDLVKKLRKKKVGKATVPLWQEPSTLLMEYALDISPSMSIALHLSNLQRISMEVLCAQSASITNQPRVLKIDDSRELYIRLGQAQAKIEETLIKFNGGGLLIWAPDNNEQIPRIMNALQKVYTDKGANVMLKIVVPFTPLPGCHSAESILDLWGHPLLHSKYDNLVKEVCFIREASRCVFTRDNTPIHTIKNVAIVSVQASLGDSKACTHVMRNMLLEEDAQGEDILIDAPSSTATAIWQKLNAMGQKLGPQPIVWKLHSRSRGNTSTHLRSMFMGHTDRVAEVEVRAIICKIKEELGEPNMIIGRKSMFADNNTIIAEGTITQFTALCSLVEECVLVSPNKALFYPKVSAQTFSNVLTDSEELRTLGLRYRKSGPLKGTIFARPKTLPSHMRAEKHNAYISRLPPNEASLLRLQAHIEILGIDGSNYDELPTKIMFKIAAETNTTLVETQDPIKALEVGEWRQVSRDGRWAGQILLQCRTTEDVHTLYDTVHGRGVCIDGVVRAIEVTSPTDVYLASRRVDLRQPMAINS